MATKKNLQDVGYYDSQGNWRSFVSNYANSSVGYYDSQGNYRGAPTQQTNTTTQRSTSSNTSSSQDRYNEILQQRNETLARLGYDNKGNPINNNGTGNNVYVQSSYQQPYAMRNYDWGDGSEYLTPDNPLVRPVVYENEFSPSSTMSMASDIYNEYYAPIVAEQQKQTTQEYRNTAQEAAATAGAAGMATGSRGAVQLANQANREATAANLQYQQQMQLQAFQDTLNARQLELENKIQDYQNAWEEVSQYGYVVTENTGNLLGIQPGQQLTTYAYKKTMSDIATNVANINAQKVQLNQQQQELDQNWAQFQEGIRQYEKDFAEQQRQFGLNYELNKKSTEAQYDSSIYTRLVDMLGRYNTVTPEMANLGAQVGMNLSVGSSTSNYLTEAERLANNQAIYGQIEGAGNQYYYDQYQLSNLSNSILPIVQSSGKIGNASQFATLLAQWKSQGVSPEYAANLIKTDEYKDIIGNVSGSRDAAVQAIYSVLGNQAGYNQYQSNQTLGKFGTASLIGSLFAPNIFSIPYNIYSSYMYANK